MRWQRLGRLFCPDGTLDWMRTHAAYPTPLVLDDRTIRVFFSSRDDENRSSVGWLDAELCGDRFQVVDLATTPILSPGRRGAFDDSGVTVACVVPDGDDLRLYYLGWALGVTVPFRNAIGLAIGNARTMAFERVSEAPVLDRSDADPLSLSYPFVLRVGGTWFMWYGSTTEWAPAGGDMRHVIRAAESSDGRSWRVGKTELAATRPGESALSRPWVVRCGPGFEMWFSARGSRYRIGRATSKDGEAWCFEEDGGLEPSAQDWESESVEYASVFELSGRRYMLYNGNGFGRTGFGVASADG